MITVSVIIVSYNVRYFLELAIHSVMRSLTDLSHEIIVVDNASSDGSVEMVRDKFPGVSLIVNRENTGFACANNRALEKAQGKYIFLVNPDTVIGEDTISTLLQGFDRSPDTGMIGCRILNPDGSLQLSCRRSFPTPWVAFTRLSGLSLLFPGSRLFGRYNLTYLNPDEPAEIDALSGSFMAVRREVIETVGKLDERFFMYGEDLDWCYRIKKYGWKIVYDPAVSIIHFKGESARQNSMDSLKYFYEAMLLFTEKHFQPDHSSVPLWLLKTAIRVRERFGVLLHAGRSLLPRFSRLKSAPKLAIVGTDRNNRELYSVLMNSPAFRDRIAGLVGINGTPKTKESPPVLGKIGEIERIVRKKSISGLVFSSSGHPYSRMIDTVLRCRRLKAGLFLVPEGNEVMIGSSGIIHIGIAGAAV
ncbi:glycosyltransferase [candidate division KSB1 bacterium]